MQQENLSCQTIEAFVDKLSQVASPEERIALSLSFMSHSLFRDKVPYFKGFWQAKETAFENLKAQTPAASPLHWAQYKELCEEFHRVKIVIDEQASFAAEQIELALITFKPHVDKILSGEECHSYSLKHLPGHGDRSLLEKLQGSFLAVHGLIEQLAALRQEVLQSSMKVRLKNRLTVEINTLIEKILPQRKEHKLQVTAAFLQFIGQFKEAHFDEKTGNMRSNRIPIIQLQREVKTLQAMAKELAITGDGFKKARQILSPCWNSLKIAHDFYKKKQIEQRSAREHAKKEIQSQIDGFKQAFDNKEITAENKEEKRHNLIESLKNLDLTRDEMSACLNAIKQILEPFYAEEEKQRKATLHAAKEALSAHSDKTERLRSLLKMEPATTLLEEAMQLFSTLKLSLIEKVELEPTLLIFSDHVSRLQGPDLAIENARRREIRESLAELKRLAATFGGADFQRALLYNQALQKHKERLLLTDTIIAALEEGSL